MKIIRIAIFILLVLIEIVSPSFSAEVKEILTLEEGLRLITEENRLLRIIRFTEEISREDINIANSAFYPEINAFVKETLLAHEPGARFGLVGVPTGERSSLSYGINIYQRIYDFGRTSSIYSASRKSFEKTRYDIKKVRNIVALDFINAYLDLLEAEKLVNVHEREVERYSSHVRDAESLYSEGVITKNDLLQAEVKLADARRRLIYSRNLKRLTQSRLNVLIGSPLDDEIIIEDIKDRIVNGGSQYFISLFDSLRNDREGLYKMLYERRPEIKGIELEIDSHTMMQNAMRAGYYPELFVMTGYEYIENRYQLHEDNWFMVFGLRINLLSGGRTRSEVSKISWRIKQLEEEKRKIMDELGLEVKRAILDMEYAIENFSLSEKSLKQAEENLRINTIRFSEGVGTSTEVTDAISLLTLEETNYYRSIYNLLKKEAFLQYSLGEDLIIYYTDKDRILTKE